MTDRAVPIFLPANDRDEALQVMQTDPAYTSGGWEITVHEWQTR